MRGAARRRSTSSSCSPTRACPARCRPTPRTTRACSGRSTRIWPSARAVPGHRRLHRRAFAPRPRDADRAPGHRDAAHADLRLRHAPRAHPARACGIAQVRRHDIELLKVWSDELPPHPVVAGAGGALPGEGRRIRSARRSAAPTSGSPQVQPRVAARRVVHRRHARARRRPTSPSPMPAACAPTCPKATSIAATCSTRFPFLNDLVTVELDGGAIEAVLEQGFSLDAGMVQVSGLRAQYDLGEAGRSAARRSADRRHAGPPRADLPGGHQQLPRRRR